MADWRAFTGSANCLTPFPTQAIVLAPCQGATLADSGRFVAGADYFDSGSDGVAATARPHCLSLPAQFGQSSFT